MTDEHEIFLMIDDEGGCTVHMERDELDPGNHDGRILRVIRLLVTTERPTDTTVKVVIPSVPESTPIVAAVNVA